MSFYSLKNSRNPKIPTLSVSSLIKLGLVELFSFFSPFCIIC